MTSWHKEKKIVQTFLCIYVKEIKRKEKEEPEKEGQMRMICTKSIVSYSVRPKKTGEVRNNPSLLPL